MSAPPLPSDRAQLVASAVSFLVDPQTGSSPLAQRIAFLESKGLSQNEIQVALQQASQQQGGAVQPRAYGGTGNGGAAGPIMYGRPGGQQGGFEYQRDWRDWFVMAVVGGGVGWLAVKLAQKFLVPHLQPPTETDLEASQKALEAKYDEAAELLKTLQESTDAVAQSLDEQRAEIDKELEEVRDAVREMREGEKKRDEWAKNIGRQVDEMAKSLPGLLDKQASAQSSSLTDLQTELRSLKSLLIARRPTPTQQSSSSSISNPTGNGGTLSTSVSSPSLPFAIKPPGLPAWQLKGSASSSSLSTAASGSATPTAAPTDSTTLENKDPSASGVLVEKPVEDQQATAADGPAPSS
ncbi:hypothetical protein BMF94_3923 [Rhodotorula taiwanensis]|uniref:Peroxisomal membrane protein PEX14 n=1 Tax=Rhodotorula taiwanensis TaxID=741276 RepID=A0A2S5B8J9_9BASI|nr:hypothetical protein BMF94_3923 [Rhodotorula taiwanensis]